MINWEELREAFEAVWDTIDDDSCELSGLFRGLANHWKLPIDFADWWQRFIERMKQ